MRLESARATADAVRSGQISAVDVCRAALTRIAASNPAVNAFLTVADDRALAFARRAHPSRSAAAWWSAQVPALGPTHGRCAPSAGLPHSAAASSDSGPTCVSRHGPLAVVTDQIGRSPPGGCDAALPFEEAGVHPEIRSFDDAVETLRRQGAEIADGPAPPTPFRLLPGGNGRPARTCAI